LIVQFGETEVITFMISMKREMQKYSGSLWRGGSKNIHDQLEEVEIRILKTNLGAEATSC